MMASSTSYRFHFSSALPGHTIYGSLHLPPYLGRTKFCAPAKGIVCISHGMCEHRQRYAEFAGFLARNGYVVAVHDHLGHGESAPTPEELGFFGETDGAQHLIDDLHTVVHHIRRGYPYLPCFLLAHSMGSFIARCYLARWGGELAGAILMGTSGTNPLCGAGILLSEGIISSQGPRYRSQMLEETAFVAYNSRIENQRTPFDWISRDDRIVSRYMADEQCNFIFTAAGFRDLFTLLKQATQPDTFVQTPDDLPILLMSGDADPVGDYGAGPLEVKNRYLDAGKKDVTLHMYAGARHELLNEINRAQVWQDILSFLETHRHVNLEAQPHAETD